MEKIGEVVSVNGDYAEVVIKKESACGENCASCGMCDVSKLRKVTVKNECMAGVGDTVEIFLESWKTIFLAVITFVLPIALFFASFFFLENELISALVLAFGFVICAYLANIIAKSKAFVSKAVIVIKKLEK